VSAISEWPESVHNALWTAAVVIGALIIWFLVHRLIRRWVRSKVSKLSDAEDLGERAKAQRLDTIAGTMETLVLLVIVVGAVVYVMLIWGIPIGPLIAGFGVIGLAVGFGAQNFVKDVIAGFFVLVEDQYSLGDSVSIADVSGTVEDIRLRTTVLRSLDGAVHHVPNGEVRVASNFTPDYSRMVIDLGISYDADVDSAIGAIGDEAARFVADPEWAKAHAGEPVVLGVEELGDSAVVIRTVFTTDPDQRGAVKREFLRRVKYRLDAEGIELAYPHLQIVQGGDQP
jgi:small conductance mechanosensitive channel